MKEVRVKVLDKQVYSTHSDQGENIFIGNVTEKNDSIFITYKEKTTGVNTVIKASDNYISVNRMGQVNGKLMFEIDRPYKTLYGTPYGNLEMTIVTKKSEAYLNNDQARIYIEYSIFIGNDKVSDNTFEITTI